MENKIVDYNLSVIYLYLAPKTPCPYYLTLINLGTSDFNVPLMKDGNIIIFEEVEQAETAYDICDNKNFFGPKPLDLTEPGLYNYPKLPVLIHKKDINMNGEVFDCASILDDFASALNISPPKKHQSIFSDIFLQILVKEELNDTLAKHNHTREDIMDAFRWYMRAVADRALLLPMNGKLHKPTCPVEDVLGPKGAP